MSVEVVYATSRYEQRFVDAPALVSIVTSEEIKSFGYRTLTEIRASTRGFHTTYDRAYHY